MSILFYCIAAFAFIMAYAAAVREKNREIAMAQRNLKHKAAALVDAHKRIDASIELRQQDMLYRQLQDQMIERLLRQNEQYSKTNVACRCLIEQYERQAKVVAQSLLKVTDELRMLGMSVVLRSPQYEHCANSIDLLYSMGVDMSDIGDMVKQMQSLLPRVVTMEGVWFSPYIIRTDNNSLALCYTVSRVDLDSKHIEAFRHWRGWFSPFFEGLPKIFLWKCEPIDSEYQLETAIMDCYTFLKKNNLLPNDTDGNE